MTCRDFKHKSEDLTLWELTGSKNTELLQHAEACQPCGAWFEDQRSLAASMQTLQAGTSGLEAGPGVEQALLRAFRQVPRPSTVPVAVGERSRPSPAAPGSTSFALRLSRWFEIGAYAAVATAVVLAMFVGLRLLHEHSSTPEQAAATLKVSPAHQADAASRVASHEPEPPSARDTGTVVASKDKDLRSAHRMVAKPAVSTAAKTAVEDSQTTADAGYVPLMFCDPLSCSSETQVVRMELPATGPDSQPQVADVVVGYDGLVRAVRIVN